MTDIIEDIAKAMWDVRRACANNAGVFLEYWGDGTIPKANWIMEEARAAFAVMREPTREMMVAGALVMPDYDPSIDDAAECWRAMIDKASEVSKDLHEVGYVREFDTAEELIAAVSLSNGEGK